MMMMMMMMMMSAEEREGEPVQTNVDRRSEGGPGPDYVAYIVVFLGNIIICLLYKLTLSDKAQVTLQMKVSLADLM
jgi:hypothetical protein